MTQRLLFAITIFFTLSAFLLIPVDSRAQIFFSAGEEIRIIQSGEIESEFLIDANANSLATDIVGGHIYWSETAGSGTDIKRANLDGSDVMVVVNQRDSAIKGLTLDLENDMLYWVDLRNDGKIYRADLDGGNIELIVDGEGNENTDGALDVALDLKNEKLYWPVIGAIMRSDLDGGNVETAYELSFVQPTAIEVNSRDGFVYWVNTNVETIMRADINSGEIEVLLEADEPYGLSVDVEGGKIFWISDFFFEGTGQVSYASLDGTGAQPITDTSFTRGAISGSGWEMATSSELIADQPAVIRLSQNYPNPFNPQTVIEYHLAETQAVTLTIHNAIGQQVAILAEHRIQNAGSHQIEFDASSLPSGVYFYQLRSDGFSYTRKMTLLK